MMAMDPGAIENELVNLGNRASSMHRRVGGIQVEVGDVKAEVIKLDTEVKGLREDIAEVKTVVEKEGEANRASNNRLLMALVGFALTAAGSALTVAITLGGS